MSNLTNNRVVKAFAELRAAGRKALVPFITAGCPDLAATEALLADFAARGVRVCELGVPFSDPVADGPIIQNSYSEALANGVTWNKIADMVRHFRASYEPAAPAAGQCSTCNCSAPLASRDRKAKHSEDPHGGAGQLAILAMVSYSIVFRHGPEAFIRSAADAGIDGLIVPDLPLEEAGAFAALAEKHNVANVLLVAPNTPPQRRYEIARHSRGFLYYISVAGITGERKALPPETVAAVAELRKHTDVPICVGFGVSDAATVHTVCQSADGAIVGSAIVHRIIDAKTLPREKMVSKVGEFVGELLKGTEI